MKVSDLLFKLFVGAFFVFALAFMAYQNVGMAREEGGSRFWLMRIILLLDVICVIVMIACYSRKYRGIHMVCLLWLMVMPVIMYLNHNSLADTVRVILWPLLFETTYLCCQLRRSRSTFFRYVFIILAIIGAGYFLETRIGANHQTNTIYFCFLTLPWLMFNTKKRTMIIILFVFTALCLLSMKRSVMLAVVMVWAFYFLYGMKSKRSQLYTIVISILILGGVYLVYDKIDDMSGGYLTEHVNKEETDEGKGREAIWAITINMIQTSSPGKLITGHGHFGVRQNSFLEISAHNDFLEVVYDYGLIIFFLYLCLWGYVIRRAFYLFKARSIFFLPYATSLSIFLVMSMVSHLILYTTYFNYLVMFWGMTEAILEIEAPKLFKKKRRFTR